MIYEIRGWDEAVVGYVSCKQGEDLGALLQEFRLAVSTVRMRDSENVGLEGFILAVEEVSGVKQVDQGLIEAGGFFDWLVRSKGLTRVVIKPFRVS